MNTNLVRKNSALVFCALSLSGCAGQGMLPMADGSEPVITQQMQETELRSLLEKVKRVRRDFVERLGLSALSFEYVEGCAAGFPVLRYRVGGRCLFLEVDRENDTVIDAYFADGDQQGASPEAIVDPKNDAPRSIPRKAKD